MLSPETLGSIVAHLIFVALAVGSGFLFSKRKIITSDDPNVPDKYNAKGTAGVCMIVFTFCYFIWLVMAYHPDFGQVVAEFLTAG